MIVGKLLEAFYFKSFLSYTGKKEWSDAHSLMICYTLWSSSNNNSIVAILSESEIWETLKNMNPTKAMGLDGMHVLFYQRYWNIVRRDVVRTI